MTTTSFVIDEPIYVLWIQLFSQLNCSQNTCKNLTHCKTKYCCFNL